VSRRGEIILSPDEQLELLEAARIVVVSTIGPRGWPHSMPMWFTLREPEGEPLPDGPPRELWAWTYAKSQKARNLERDPRATLLVETGEEYLELRGVQIEAEAELIRDPDRVLAFGKELTVAYSEGIESIEGDAAAALQAQAAKRVAIRFEAKRVATWDHRKLGGTY
jgi:PPOX class probable F420-dependent enzyme